MTCEQLVAALQEAMGANLVSVVLYGSSAAGDFVPGLSAYDILIVGQRLGAAELAALQTTLVRWEQAGNPLPQLFTAQELADAADVFPIELLDLQQTRRVLYGPDPLADLQINMQHYRGQLERELKVRVQALRRRYVVCRGNQEQVAHLLAASVATFLVLLRAALRLYNEPVPADKAAVLDPLGKHLACDLGPVRAALELRTGTRSLQPSEVEGLFAKYLQAIEQVVHAVDRFLHSSPHEK